MTGSQGGQYPKIAGEPDGRIVKREWPDGLDGLDLHRLHCRDDRCNGGLTCGCPCHRHDGLYPVSLQDTGRLVSEYPGHVQLLTHGDDWGMYVDTRDQDTRLLDHERMRVNGSILAARLGQDQSAPPFPAQGYPGDCGLDLATAEAVTLEQGGSANVPCGVAVALPPGTFGWICGRSSTWTKWGLWVMPGIIDEGWRGELRTLVHRPYAAAADHKSTMSPITIPAGTRLAQLIVLPNLIARTKLWRVLPDDLPPHERGENGFGSTG